MTQPSYVPISEADQVRPAYRLQTPNEWRQDRVAELTTPVHPRGRDLGAPGTDQGYALLVARDLFADRITLTAGITLEDAIVGSAALATARASLFGRAPVGKDVEIALLLFGFLGSPPPDLLAWRHPLFQAASHHYRQQRRIVEAVPESTCRLTLDQIKAQLSDWRTLVITG